MRVALTLGTSEVFDEELDGPMDLALNVQLDMKGERPPTLELTLDLESNLLTVSEFSATGIVLNRTQIPLVHEFAAG